MEEPQADRRAKRRRIQRVFLTSLVLNSVLIVAALIWFPLTTLHIHKVNQQLGETNNQLAESRAEAKSASKEAQQKAAEAQTALQAQAKIADQLKNQQAQLSQNAEELQKLRKRPPLFSFKNDSASADRSDDETAIKTLLESSFDELTALYGFPYLLHQITIDFVDQFDRIGVAGETEIDNTTAGFSITIHLKGFSPNSFQDINTVIHETSHGFHGVSAFNPVAYEEGMAVAVADLTMDRLQAQDKIRTSERYLDQNDQSLELLRNTVKVPRTTDAFYQGTDVSKRYQIVGRAFYDLEKSNPGFMLRLNERTYGYVATGQEMDYTTMRRFITDAYTGTNPDLLQVKGILLD